jgi:hypothetical protein
MSWYVLYAAADGAIVSVQFQQHRLEKLTRWKNNSQGDVMLVRLLPGTQVALHEETLISTATPSVMYVCGGGSSLYTLVAALSRWLMES